MKVYNYTSYDEYKNIQTETNIKKINNVWVNESTIEKIVSIQPDAKMILCHGVRNAKELEYFQRYSRNSVVVGTEISHTATRFPNVVQWDFHDENREWLDKFDIVYSNSFDHSYDPEKSLRAWKNQINETGKIFLEHGYGIKENVSKSSDPLEIYDNEIKDLFRKINLKLVGEFETTGLKKIKAPARVYILQK